MTILNLFNDLFKQLDQLLVKVLLRIEKIIKKNDMFCIT